MRDKFWMRCKYTQSHISDECVRFICCCLLRFVVVVVLLFVVFCRISIAARDNQFSAVYVLLFSYPSKIYHITFSFYLVLFSFLRLLSMLFASQLSFYLQPPCPFLFPPFSRPLSFSPTHALMLREEHKERWSTSGNEHSHSRIIINTTGIEFRRMKQIQTI